MLFHTVKDTSEIDFPKGFIKAIELAKENGTNEVVLLTPVLENINGVIAATLGDDFAKKINQDRMVGYDGVIIYLETQRTLSSSNFKLGIALAIFAYSTFLSTIIGDSRVTDSIYVPWTHEELSDYLKAYADSEQI